MDAVRKLATPPLWKRALGRAMEFAEAMEASPIDRIESRVAYLERRLAALEGDPARDRRLPNTRNI